MSDYTVITLFLNSGLKTFRISNSKKVKRYCMEVLERKYIIDEKNRKVAVQLDIKTFKKIEDIMENYALFKLMEENEGEESLDLRSAKLFYSQLEKSN